jgi:maltose/moltooligosaccharide transporter
MAGITSFQGVKNIRPKPHLSRAAIWNMSIGFLGIQCGFGLQNSNASRILQTFGADVHELSWFWLVAPITGMIVQPIIGHYSDNTWTRFGRRRPYFLAGAILASIGLVLLPNAALFSAFVPILWVGAGMLMIMDASINIAMEPFRALVADKLPSEQRTLGFSVQTVIIGIGAVIGSWLPYVLTNWFGVENTAADGGVPMNLILSFVVGAIILLATIIWTVTTTTEYSPEEQAAFAGEETVAEGGKFSDIFKDFAAMPKTMKQLGLVQFFSWFALFSMWVFTTPALAQHVWGLAADDTKSEAFNAAGDFVGPIFGTYNLVAMFYAFLLPFIASKIGRKGTHAFSLVCGGLGLMSIYLITSPEMKSYLHLSMVGVGMAWGSILAMPYAILAGAIPLKKMGIYMGIFNFFITLPQITNGIFGGLMVKYLYGNHAIYAIVGAGLIMILGAVAVLFVEDKDEVVA